MSDLPLASGVPRVAPAGRKARTTLLVAVIGSSMAVMIVCGVIAALGGVASLVMVRNAERARVTRPRGARRRAG